MSSETHEAALECPSGQAGPWRYVEQIEVWREVLSATEQGLVIDSEWYSGEGFNEGVPGTGYLLCWYRAPEGRCGERAARPTWTPETRVFRMGSPGRQSSPAALTSVGDD